MLRNISYKDHRLKEEIEKIVGPSFSFRERWKMKSIGTPQMLIHECSEEIADLLEQDSNRNTCIAELRPKGIIIRFRSRLETYGLIVPYWKLSFYQNGTVWSFHADGKRIQAEPLQSGKGLHHFKSNLLGLKGQGEMRVDDC